MKRLITIFIVLIIAGLIAFRLLHNRKTIQSKAQVKDNSEQLVPVMVTRAEKESTERNLKMVGTVLADKIIDVKSEVQGQITSLKFELGDKVRKGQSLASIDDKIRSLAVNNANQKLADARQNFQRYKNLYEGGAATKAQFEQYKLALDNAQNQLAQARKELSNTKVLSPISGIISKRHVEKGSFANTGTPIATIVDLSKLKIKLSISENDVYQLHVGDSVTITSGVYPNTVYKGGITFISPNGDEAHNYPIEISINNKKEKPLKSGTYVDVYFSKKNPKDILQIPREALVGSKTDAKVYVISDNNIARLKPVKLGEDYGNSLEVIEGVEKGQLIVTSGQINLTDSTKVRISNKI